MKLYSFFWSAERKILAEIQHASNFRTTAFSYVQKVNELCIRARFLFLCDVVHDGYRGSLYLVFESPVFTGCHHLVYRIHKSPCFLPYIQILNTSLHPCWLVVSSTRCLSSLLTSCLVVLLTLNRRCSFREQMR